MTNYNWASTSKKQWGEGTHYLYLIENKSLNTCPQKLKNGGASIDSPVFIKVYVLLKHMVLRLFLAFLSPVLDLEH